MPWTKNLSHQTACVIDSPCRVRTELYVSVVTQADCIQAQFLATMPPPLQGDSESLYNAALFSAYLKKIPESEIDGDLIQEVKRKST